MELENALLHSGRLLIKTEGHLGRRSWVLRHVLLAGRTLEWYADELHTQVVGSVNLEGAFLIVPEDAKHPYMLELDWDGQDYLPMRALSAPELKDWIVVSRCFFLGVCSLAQLSHAREEGVVATQGAGNQYPAA